MIKIIKYTMFLKESDIYEKKLIWIMEEKYE